MPAVTFHGIPAIAHPLVENVYWGADFADPTKLQSSVAYMDTFTKDLIASPFQDEMAQYGVGHGTFLGSDVLTAAPTSGAVSVDQITAALQAEVDAGRLPAWGSSTVFQVDFPPAVTFADSLGVGYHTDRIELSPGSFQPQDRIFCSLSAQYGTENTVLSSHELAESFTDPSGGGWFDDAAMAASLQGEIADLAATDPVHGLGSVDGYQVTGLWSDAAGGVVVPEPLFSPPGISQPQGSAAMRVESVSVRPAPALPGQRKAKAGSEIVLTLNTAANASTVGNPYAYHLASLPKGRHGKAQALILTKVSYDSSSMTITLFTSKPLTSKTPVQLRIASSSLTDALGRPLDGDHDGQPGGDFVATIHGSQVQIG